MLFSQYKTRQLVQFSSLQLFVWLLLLISYAVSYEDSLCFKYADTVPSWWIIYVQRFCDHSFRTIWIWGKRRQNIGPIDRESEKAGVRVVPYLSFLLNGSRFCTCTSRYPSDPSLSRRLWKIEYISSLALDLLYSFVIQRELHNSTTNEKKESWTRTRLLNKL